MKLWSQEWAEAVKAKSGDADYLKKTKGFTTTLHFLALDCPGGVDKRVEWDFQDGKVASLKLSEEAAGGSLRSVPSDESKVLFRGVGSYDTWCKLHKKELTTAQGLTGGTFKVEGDMMKVMPKIGAIDAFNNLMSSVSAEY